jgi:predicted nucleic acid-binding Zn ribbon protein
MCDWADEFATNLMRVYRVARKRHYCRACGEAIEPGQRYHVDSNVFDGNVSTWKHCARCWAMIEVLWERNRLTGDWGATVDFELNCGEVWRDPPPEIAALAFALPGDKSP